MKTQLSLLARRIGKAFSQSQKLRNATQCRQSRLSRRPVVEALEFRRLLATLYVDNPGDFSITTDTAPPGLSTGDTVTWDPGAGSQHGAAVTGLTFGTNAFGTIQAAVNAAVAGDTIRVAGGTFVEGVNVNKQLFVLGNQTGVDAQSGRVGAAETIVTGVGNNGVTPFYLTASDVVLNGFTVEGATSGNQFGFGILLAGGTAGYEIRNNIVQNNIIGLGLANNSASNQTAIEGNLFRANIQPGPASGNAIYTDQFVAGGALTNVLINNNTFSGHTDAALNLSSTQAGSQSNITFSSNIVTGNGRAAFLLNVVNSSIAANEITGSAFGNTGDIRIFGGVSGLSITNNLMQNGVADAIRISDSSGTNPNSNITINRNSISNYAGHGLNLVDGYTGGLNAEFNWWGSATGPTIASNPGGTGESIVDAAGQVDYIPFLPNGVDTQPAVRGFQPSIADLSITKSDAPDPVVPGTTLTYQIVVTNIGPDTQTGATITDTFPTGFTGVTFTSTASPGATGNTASGSGSINDTVTMSAGSTITYNVTGTVSSSASGSLSNTATVTPPANTFDTDTTNNSDTEITTVGPAQADMQVVKTDAPDPVAPGTNLTYTITVTNAGPSDAQTVSLTDGVPVNTTFVSFTAPAGWTPATPAPGGTGAVTATRATLPAGSGAQVFTLVVNVNSSTANGSTITNTATVATATTDTNGGNNSDTETTAVAAAADLSVTKVDTPDPVVAGNNLTYTITVTNAGANDAQGLTLTDAVPANTTFVSFTAPAGWTSTTPAVGGTGTVTATRPTLAAGSPQSFVLVVNANASTPNGATLSNTATVTSTTADPNTANNTDTETTSVVASADVAVTKIDTPDPVLAGQNITYTITVTNSGPSDAQNVTATDVVPAGTTFASFTSISQGTAVFNAGVITASFGTLTAGSSATLSFVVTVDSTTPNGTVISNTVNVTSTTTDGNAANNTVTQTTTVSPPAPTADLSVTKTDTPDPVAAGANLTYTIVVLNSGPNDAQSVSLTDAVPANTTFVSLTSPAGWTSTTPAVGGTGTVTSTRATLAAGSGPQTFTLVVRANASSASGTTITNTATVTTTTIDPNSVNNSDTETTAVVTSADVSVTKSDSPDSVAPGENLTYTIVVANNGPSNAQGVTLTDVLPPGTTFVSFVAPAGWTATTPPAGGTGTVTAVNPTLAAGATATFTLVVQVDPAAVPGTTISNTAAVATATADPNAANNADTETTEVAVADPLDCEVTTLNSPGATGTATLEDDLDNPGTGVLIVTGTDRNDVIIVEPRPGNASRIRVTRNGQQIAAFNRSEVQHIVVFGLAGNDKIVINGSLSQRATLFGDAGSDQLFAARGNDGLDGGIGNDSLYGGLGNDTLCGFNGNDVMYGQGGNDRLGGEQGSDRLFGEAGFDLLVGGDGNDSAFGGSGNDLLFGQLGNDQLFGDSGNDVAVGGEGNDRLFGDGGRDILIGGLGRDELFGETQDDILVGGSTIHDEDPDALAAILSEWASNRGYGTRVSNIRFGGGNNGGFTLNDGTVIDDGISDTLFGDGQLDWFWSGTGDRIRDRARGEVVN